MKRSHFFCFRHVEAHRAEYINNLKDAVAIKSVSAWPDTRPDITTMINWTVDKLKAIGTTIELADVGEQTLPDGRKLALPKVILGILGNVSVKQINFRRYIYPLHLLDLMDVAWLIYFRKITTGSYLHCSFDNGIVLFFFFQFVRSLSAVQLSKYICGK